MMIAIASGKGGVGKTWLAVTLAQALARLERRVLLFDGDLGLANVDVQLGLDPARDLGTVVAGRCALADAVQSYPPGGFDLLAGRSGSGGLATLGAGRLELLLDDLSRLARGYDVVLLDLPAGIDVLVRRLLAAASLRLVVTTDEPTALTDAYALIKLGVRQGAGAFALVVNLASGRGAGERTHDGLRRVCGRFLGLELPLAGVVRRDPRVPDAIRHQMPLLTRHPLAPAARDVEALAQRLVGWR
jgi:flagellar biosynthesis protein FlhG